MENNDFFIVFLSKDKAQPRLRSGKNTSEISVSMLVCGVLHILHYFGLGFNRTNNRHQHEGGVLGAGVRVPLGTDGGQLHHTTKKPPRWSEAGSEITDHTYFIATKDHGIKPQGLSPRDIPNPAKTIISMHKHMRLVTKAVIITAIPTCLVKNLLSEFFDSISVMSNSSSG